MNFGLTICTIVLTVLGMVLLIVGIFHVHHTHFLKDQDTEIKVSILIITTAACLLGTTAIGGVALLTNKRWLLLTYGILLVPVHGLQSITGVFSILDTIRLDNFLRTDLIAKFETYYNDTGVTNEAVRKEVDEIQLNWRCCGVMNLTSGVKTLPRSCCPRIREDQNCTEEKASKTTCVGAAVHKIIKPLKMVAIFAIFFAVFEFFVALWTFYKAKTTSTP